MKDIFIPTANRLHISPEAISSQTALLKGEDMFSDVFKQASVLLH